MLKSFIKNRNICYDMRKYERIMCSNLQKKSVRSQRFNIGEFVMVSDIYICEKGIFNALTVSHLAEVA